MRPPRPAPPIRTQLAEDREGGVDQQRGHAHHILDVAAKNLSIFIYLALEDRVVTANAAS